MTEQSPQTRTVRAGMNTDPTHGAVVPPVYLSTTYAFDRFDQPREYDYSRAGNPTRSALAAAIADLEGGAGGVVTASGMAAITATVLGMLPAGGTLLAPFDCYGGSWRLFDARPHGRLTLRLTDFSDSASAAARSRPAPTWSGWDPSNPLLRITDLAAVAARPRRRCSWWPTILSRRRWSSVRSRPARTSWCTGHQVSQRAFRRGVRRDRPPTPTAPSSWRGGRTPWAHRRRVDAYRLRGLRTLHRMAAAQRNAHAVVEALVDHPAVSRALPGAEQPPAPRPRRSAAGRVRRHRHLRRGQRGRGASARRGAGVLPGRAWAASNPWCRTRPR